MEPAGEPLKQVRVFCQPSRKGVTEQDRCGKIMVASLEGSQGRGERGKDRLVVGPEKGLEKCEGFHGASRG